MKNKRIVLKNKEVDQNNFTLKQRRKKKYKMNGEKGVTMIVLVVTIIILLILTFSIGTLTKSQIIEKAREASFKTSISRMDENLKVYISEVKTTNPKYNEKQLEWDGSGKPQNTGEISGTEDTIEYILKTIPYEFNNKLSILNGELLFHEFGETEEQWIKDLGFNPVNDSIDNPKQDETDTPIVVFDNGEIKISDLTIKINSNGNILLNGVYESNEKKFIKLINGIETAELNSQNTSDSIFEQWSKGIKPFAEKGEQLTQKVEILSGTYETTNGAMFNSVARNEQYQAILNCKLGENIFETTETLNSGAVVPYLYFSSIGEKNVKGKIICNNLEISVKYTKKLETYDDIDFKLINGNETFTNLITTKIEDNNIVTVDGKAKSNGYIRLTDGLKFIPGNSLNEMWCNSNQIIANKGD